MNGFYVDDVFNRMGFTTSLSCDSATCSNYKGSEVIKANNLIVDASQVITKLGTLDSVIDKFCGGRDISKRSSRGFRSQLRIYDDWIGDNLKYELL